MKFGQSDDSRKDCISSTQEVPSGLISEILRQLGECNINMF
jgi:hypothetical protein